MSEKNKVYKPKPISGFPEWLPEYRAVELQWLDKVRAVFESYGFCSIETPSVEEIDAILAKGGDTEKEIYTLHRLYEDLCYYSDSRDGDGYSRGYGGGAGAGSGGGYGEGFSAKEPRLALHFDLTVPTARYVAQHFNSLIFPFKRYQIQRSWRGERPQKGRFREFYQADIDVINIDSLPLHFDAELPAVMYEAYQALDVPPIEIRLSNRKIIYGYLEGLGIKDIPPVTRILDKLDKIGKDNVIKMLVEDAGISEAIAKKCLALAEVKTNDTSFVSFIKDLGVENETLNKGVQELEFVVNNLSHLPKGAIKVDLSIIRGLDYYTGTIYETYLVGQDFGAIGSGGRFDDLASSFINQKLPGVGVSLGITRLFSFMMDKGLIKPLSQSPAEILVVLPSEERRTEATETASILRKRGYKVELYYNEAKVKKQLSYAERKGIPYVWFPPFSDGQEHEVKNMVNGEQTPSDPKIWEK